MGGGGCGDDWKLSFRSMSRTFVLPLQFPANSSLIKQRAEESAQFMVLQPVVLKKKGG
jgi:hypothetical protein